MENMIITASQLAKGSVVVWRDNQGNPETSTITAIEHGGRTVRVGFDGSWHRSFQSDEIVEVEA